jgi:Tfp pilus assembly protein PilN
MINLLPPDVKSNYHYARRNRTLLRWVTATSFCLLGGMLLVAGGYLYLRQSINSTQSQINVSQHQLDSQNLTKVQSQVTSISNNLKLAVQVLSKEILFSQLLQRLGTVTPDNAILTNLNITQAQGGVEIVAQTTNYDAATQLQLNLSDPKNQIFSKADIVSITCQSGENVGAYPCTVDIRALFATNNPFLFINAKGPGA